MAENYRFKQAQHKTEVRKKNVTCQRGKINQHGRKHEAVLEVELSEMEMPTLNLFVCMV